TMHAVLRPFPSRLDGQPHITVVDVIAPSDGQISNLHTDAPTWRATPEPIGGTMEPVNPEERSEEERRRRRRAGDPRITPEGREILRRLTRGDLADEFQAALDADLVNDPLLGGGPDPDDDDDP
ncbi:MAG: hypothetical protein ACREEO_03730, partial [Phenylobacterium sp.]